MAKQPEPNQDLLFYAFTREELAEIISRVEGGGSGYCYSLAGKILAGPEKLNA